MRTIQLTNDEDREVADLKDRLGLPTKKAVIMEGLRSLRKLVQAQKRRRRLTAASVRVRKQSLSVNRSWAPRGTAVTHDSD